jgi:hypothetical protein
MPAVLHEQEGLKIVKNDKNRFCVVTLHYTADPAKRSKEWEDEARSGMNSAKWAQEYCIDYTALYGKKVFPEISANKSKIVVPEPYIEFPDTQVYWGGLDYGARNPSSLHFYTIFDGVTYSVWELYEACTNIDEFVTKAKAFPHYERVRYIAADPSIIKTNSTRNSLGLPCTMNDLFVKAGFTKLLAGDTNEAAWLALIRQHWQNSDDPTFRIFDCCPNQIREFESAVYVSTSERLLQTQNYREAISDHNNHSLDDCKYFMNSRPKIVKQGVKVKDMSKWWRK